jgi:hypothetical protein
MRSVRRIFCAVLVSAIAVSTPLVSGAETSDTSLCDRLAEKARLVTASGAWGATERLLAPALQIEPESKKLTPLEAELTSLSWVKEAIGADGMWSVSIERMPGTDIYMASTVQGTLDCQTSVFLKAARVANAKPITEPMRFRDVDVCWTRSGDLGRVFDRPAFIVHGTLNDHTNDEDISVVPWSGRSWGKACKVSFAFRKVFALTRTFCGDHDICKAGEAIAVDVATAYDKARVHDSADLNFRYGPAPTDVAIEAVRRATKGLGSDVSTPEFPTFGAVSSANVPAYTADSFVFSYNGFTLFPLMLNGKDYVGAIGHYGVGWRESGRTLFAIYSEDNGTLTPLAGFEVDLTNGGLISATVERAAPKN